ncbi:hypothetical protein HALLA_05000 [Halostagnicola larsenii XH-48]|uniref:Uncharacterized protein n=1 Tax=Halostagnicola larsenii XH-48 TaxID=797299 RepID=W0JTY0_9EURY|nr:hypothetical protein HALLA_05000 [Halostagnicola larsenii XH-48]
MSTDGRSSALVRQCVSPVWYPFLVVCPEEPSPTHASECVLF